MSTEEYENVMDEAIASYKQDKRERLEEHLLDMAKIIEQIYKRENPKGTYLTICIRDEGISINNEYWDEDAYFPINVDNLEGQINHRPVPLDEEDEE